MERTISDRCNCRCVNIENVIDAKTVHLFKGLRLVCKQLKKAFDEKYGISTWSVVNQDQTKYTCVFNASTYFFKVMSSSRILYKSPLCKVTLENNGGILSFDFHFKLESVNDLEYSSIWLFFSSVRYTDNLHSGLTCCIALTPTMGQNYKPCDFKFDMSKENLCENSKKLLGIGYENRFFKPKDLSKWLTFETNALAVWFSIKS